MVHENPQAVQAEWVTFPGGELEGKRPKVLCQACRESLNREAAAIPQTARRQPAPRPLCFQCYRAELDRERALRAAGQLETASEERFQVQLPFEPVNEPRLAMLKADRLNARSAALLGVGRFVDKRRQAQIAARHALQAIAAGLRTRQVPASNVTNVDSIDNAGKTLALEMAIHAAELQLPESWLPFVVNT
jgi:hypothetical protein